MKKILISILIVLLLILGYLTIFRGMKVVNFEIKSISQIEEKNKTLDDTILDATVLATKTYEDAVKTLNADVKQLEEQKKKYDNLVSVTTSGETQSVSQYQKYEIEYLWTIIGNHATKEGVILKMDLVSGTNDTYNLNFTVTGEYIGIADFIADIENDTALGFKIEDFYMIPDTSTSDLKATFTCKEITIKDVSNNYKKITTIDVPTENTNTTNTNTTTTNTTTNSSSTQSSNTTASPSKTNDDDDDYSEEDFMRDLEAEDY